MQPNKVTELVDFLRGTCLSFDEALAVVLDSQLVAYTTQWDALLDAVSEEIFQCDSCGWWYDADEHSQDNICIECDEDEK